MSQPKAKSEHQYAPHKETQTHIRSLKERDLTLHHEDKKLSSQLSSFREETREQFAEIDERFDKVDERFDKVDERFDKVDERFDGIDRRLDGIDRRLDKMDERFDGLSLKLDQTLDLLHMIAGNIKK